MVCFFQHRIPLHPCSDSHQVRLEGSHVRGFHFISFIHGHLFQLSSPQLWQLQSQLQFFLWYSWQAWQDVLWHPWQLVDWQVLL
jgi:hypothetical protein